MVLLCFVSEGIITVLIVLYEQLWYPRKQSTAIPCYENSYDTLGNKAQQYHTMRTVMIPSETKHSNTILWEQLWYPRKQSTSISYYENSYDTLGNKAQQYHTMRTVMIPSETKHSDTILWAVLCFRGYHNCSHSMILMCFVSEGIITVLIVWYSLCFVSEGIITVLIVWYCCALFPRES